MMLLLPLVGAGQTIHFPYPQQILYLPACFMEVAGNSRFRPAWAAYCTRPAHLHDKAAQREVVQWRVIDRTGLEKEDLDSTSMVELDGAFGEGGGQILRTSLALSLLTGKAFHLRNVRAGREKPGLQPQHLMSVQAAATVGHGRTRGAAKGSTDLEFEPGTVTPGSYHFAIGTAGATGLVLHTIYLPLALAGADSDITIDGGTHVATSPCFHFLETTWSGYLDLMGLKVGLKMQRPGFYPRGGGLLKAHIAACPRLQGIGNLEPSAGTAVHGFSAVAGLPEHIARRQAERASRRLQHLDLAANIREETWSGGPGTVLALILNTHPVPTLFFDLGKRGKPAERVADEAVAQLAHYLKCQPAVDKHSADQILLPLCLAKGPSTFPAEEISSHLLTNAAVIQRFVERDIRIEGNEGEPGVVHIV
jgi:RNA 3'-phosphate cyclase